jgi:hypothetical protein
LQAIAWVWLSFLVVIVVVEIWAKRPSGKQFHSSHLKTTIIWKDAYLLHCIANTCGIGAANEFTTTMEGHVIHPM